MTPETIRHLQQLRQEFYTHFSAALPYPVKVTSGSSYAGNPATASWIDGRQRFNYLCIFAYAAPDDLMPDRPFILKLMVNKGTDVTAITLRQKDCNGLNRSCQLELTLLPGELRAFLPWLVRFVQCRDSSSAQALIQETPAILTPTSLYSQNTRTLTQSSSSHLNLWTHKASEEWSHDRVAGAVSYG
ncbi:MAG: hypothetical protein MUF49_00145 [Oculatellaceae cyanobacterium Prado106]|jgi:hypothetical protein|nr:hypothetical protein [Oculatellaceae cyanobacterium Prado106]